MWCLPRLTVAMVGLIQGFPPGWKFVGKKTHAYRQVGNAFPPPVAKAVALAVKGIEIAGAPAVYVRGRSLNFQAVFSKDAEFGTVHPVSDPL